MNNDHGIPEFLLRRYSSKQRDQLIKARLAHDSQRTSTTRPDAADLNVTSSPPCPQTPESPYEYDDIVDLDESSAHSFASPAPVFGVVEDSIISNQLFLDEEGWNNRPEQPVVSQIDEEDDQMEESLISETVFSEHDPIVENSYNLLLLSQPETHPIVIDSEQQSQPLGDHEQQSAFDVESDTSVRLRNRPSTAAAAASGGRYKKKKSAEKYPILSPCECKRMKCSSKLNEDDRQDIWGHFHSLTYSSQRAFIVKHVKAKDVSCRKNHVNSRRSSTFEYTLKDFIICKTMFIRTLGHKNDKFVMVALKNAGVEDKRGKAPKPHRFSENQQAAVKEHIQSFHPDISHYRRAHAPNRLYLDHSLSITDLYKDYRKKILNEYVSYARYAQTLREMNISFAKLGNEQCEICLNHDVHKKEECPGESCDTCSAHTIHKETAEKIRGHYRNDAADALLNPSNTSYLSVDLQKVKMLPEIPGVKSAVFTGRIACYNETFSPLGKNTGSESIAILWHQGIQERNDEDITSAYLKLLNEPKFHEKPNLVFYMDNCSAQNKHWTFFTVMVAYMNQLPETSELMRVTLKYFEPGHTFMSADSFHALVEKKFKKAANIYDFRDYVDCVRAAGNAIEMKPEDFYQFESGLSQKAATKESKPLLADVYVAEFRRDELLMFFKKDPESAEFNSTDFLKNKPMKLMAEKKYFSQIKSKSRSGIPASRKTGIIEKLCSMMPASRREFWKSLPTSD